METCSAAFKSLRGAAGTDALGQPQKAVKMVTDDARAKKTARSRKPDVTKLTVAALREALQKRGLSAQAGAALKNPADRAPRAAMAENSDSDSSEASEAFSKLTVPKLREALEARGLDTSGLKAALVARLEGAAKKAAATKKKEKETDGSATRRAIAASRVVMVRKMAAHGGRAIGTADNTASDIVSGAKRKAGAAEEKKPRRNPRPSRRARLAAKGVYE